MDNGGWTISRTVTSDVIEGEHMHKNDNQTFTI